MQNHFIKKLQDQDERNLLRELQLPTGVDFCSNDYLSFASDPILQKRILKALTHVSLGSTGSRLLRGHHDTAVNLERLLAQWSGREEALFFSSGYQANLALLSAVLGKDSIVYSDELNHASLIDGIRLSGCQKRIFKHNDVADLEALILKDSSKAHKVLVVESLYSMRGDQAPLEELLKICTQHNVQMIVDELHATGVYGAGHTQRLGIQSQMLATVHGAGKALGVSGAWIACDSVTKDFLINFSRPFIYSTAPSPLLTEAVRGAVEYWQEIGEDRAEFCLEKSKDFKKMVKAFMRDEAVLGDGPITFLQLNESLLALNWSHALQMRGFDVRAIRYPTVPENLAGLRIIVHANQADADIKSLTSAIRQLVTEC